MRSVLFLRPPGKKKSSFEEERDIKSINGFIKRDGLNLGHQFVLNIFKKYVSLCKCCCYYLWVLFPLLLKTNVYIFFVVCFYWDAENLLRLEAGDSAFSLIQPGVELAGKLESGF